MSSSEKDSTLEEKHDEAVKNKDEIFERIMYMPTLPSAFKSLVGRKVKIEMEEPRCLIELLGDLLGITDYKINKAAFWFLDTIALHVLRYKNRLDDHYRGVLISWLAGEMTLIRDKRLLREDFFKEMRMLFLYVAEKLSNGDQLSHWELLVDEYFKIMSKNSLDESIKRRVEYSVTNKLSEEELIAEDKHASQENAYLIERDLKIRNSENKKSITNLEEKPSNNFTNSLTTERLQTDTFINANTISESSKLIDSNIVLDVIIEATYSMYANELRYALIHAVFVMPIPIEIYHMRHTLRIPRRIKLADPERGPFDIQLYEKLKKSATEESKVDRSKRYKGKNNAKKGQIVNDMDTKLPPTPASSLDDEEILAYNRQFILPLIEAKEAAQKIFELYAEDT